MVQKYSAAASLLGIIILLSACDPVETDPGPGGVNAGDAKALDDAAKKLDERQSAPEKEIEKGD